MEKGKTQKLEFIKKTKVEATEVRSYYYSSIDGLIVSDSLSYDEKEARKIYEFIKANMDKHDTEEILEEHTIYIK
jgi:hypothetical protein